MTTPSTGDARAEERVVEAVARALETNDFDGPVYQNVGEYWMSHARAAIEAYRKAMRDPT